MSGNGKDTIFWDAYIQTEKCWGRDPLVLNYPVTARAGLPECLHALSPSPHLFCSLQIYISRRKQTAPALVIFSGDMLQMLHFPVTLYPTLSV